MPVLNLNDGRPVDQGGGGGDDDDMEARLAKLEALAPTLATKVDLADLRTDVAKIETAVHRSLNEQTWKLIGTIVFVSTALVGATYFIVRMAGPAG